MARVIWTEVALSDIEEIAEYIALDKLEAARSLVAKVFQSVERLGEFPNSGRRPPELPKNTRYREVVVGPCRIFYRVTKNTVYILHVMRSERILRRFMLVDDKPE